MQKEIIVISMYKTANGFQSYSKTKIHTLTVRLYMILLFSLFLSLFIPPHYVASLIFSKHLGMFLPWEEASREVSVISSRWQALCLQWNYVASGMGSCTFWVMKQRPGESTLSSVVELAREGALCLHALSGLDTSLQSLPWEASSRYGMF